MDPKPEGVYISQIKRSMLDMLFMSSTFPGYNLFVSLFSGIHSSYNPAFPFDLPMQSGILTSCAILSAKVAIKDLKFKK